jgi:hypothetical protein
METEIASCGRLTLSIRMLSYLVLLLFIVVFVGLEAKQIIHSMTKFTINLNHVFTYNKNSLPPLCVRGMIKRHCVG